MSDRKKKAEDAWRRRVPVMPSPRLYARIRRIALVRLGECPRGALPRLGLEALIQFADAEEAKLALPKLTDDDLPRYLPPEPQKKS